MRPFYLDSNAVSRLAEDDTAHLNLIDLHKAKAVRFVFGWRLVWELAGVYELRTDRIPEARKQADLLLRFLKEGAALAREGWGLSLEAASRPARERWTIDPLMRRGSNDYLGGIHTLGALRDPGHEAETRAWYRSYAPLQEGYRKAERDFRDLLRDKFAAAGISLVDRTTIRAIIRDLEVRGWLQEVVRAGLRQRGIRCDGSEDRPLDWFGPLGRFARASNALSLLQATKRPTEDPVRPERGDLSDLVHIVTAGLVGAFVTRDETAKEVFHATWPERTRRCLHYEREFLPYLRSLAPTPG